MNRFFLLVFLIAPLHGMTRDQAEEAVLNENTASIAHYLDEGHDVNETNDAGWTLLHHAAARGKCNTMALLLKRGAALTVQSKTGNTPLHCAVENGCAQATAILYWAILGWRYKTLQVSFPVDGISPDHGVTILKDPINYQNNAGRTVLHLAAEGNHRHITWILLKIQAGYLTDNRGKTPIHDAIDHEAWETLQVMEQFAQIDGKTEFTKIVGSYSNDVLAKITSSRVSTRTNHKSRILVDKALKIMKRSNQETHD